MSDVQGNQRFADDSRRYRLDSRIATGGMGEVWRATDTVLDRPVAVKLLKHEYADDAQFRSRFETEARHAAALHHPGVAGVYDFGEAAGDATDPHPKPFLVMELVDGQPLLALIGRGRELDPEAVRDLMAQTGDALAAAHAAGIVHRDVKPANLLVTPDRQVKVTDFGIARAAEGVGITQTGAVMGTPQYLSPEQARGETATPASDVYSLGVVAFECLAGRRPFEADSPVATALAHLHDPVPDLPATVPGDLAAVVRRAMSKDPADRYADGGAFADALRDPAGATAVVPPVAASPAEESATQVLPAVGAGAAAAAGATGAGASLATPPPDEPGSGGRRTWLWVLLVVLLVVGIAVVAFALTSGDEDDDPPPVEQSPTRSRTTEPTSQAPTTEPTEEAPPSSEEPPPTQQTSEPPQEPTTEPTTEPSPTLTSEPPSDTPDLPTDPPTGDPTGSATGAAPDTEGESN